VLRESKLDWTIFQPSVIFGPEDTFLNRFAGLLKWFPVVPLAAADARFQPVYVGDVAKALLHALDDARSIGRTYPLCGPKVYSLRELMRYTGEMTGYRRPIIGLGASLAAIQAAVLELLPGKLLTRDNLRSMERDNVCDCPFPPLLAIEPTPLEAIAPTYLGAAALGDRYSVCREKRRS
jgi:NADH dehydrogenase